MYFNKKKSETIKRRSKHSKIILGKIETRFYVLSINFHFLLMEVEIKVESLNFRCISRKTEIHLLVGFLNKIKIVVIYDWWLS